MADYEKEPTNPSHLSNIFSPVVSILENYGWYILIFFIILAYWYQKSLKSTIDQYRQWRNETEYAAKYHKNPDLLNARLIAQEKRVLELQEKLNRDAEQYQKKLKEQEERKRKELLEKLGEGGHRLGSADTSTKNNKTGFKPDHNPLDGPGSSSNYRPPKRSACSRGGCG